MNEHTFQDYANIMMLVYSEAHCNGINAARLYTARFPNVEYLEISKGLTKICCGGAMFASKLVVNIFSNIVTSLDILFKFQKIDPLTYFFNST